MLDTGGDRIEGGTEAMDPGRSRLKPGSDRSGGGERILDAAVTLTEEVLLKVDVAKPESEEVADIEPERWRGGAANCCGRTWAVLVVELFGGVVAVSLALIRIPV